MWSILKSEPAPQRELNQRLKRIAKVFPIAPIVGQPSTAGDVVDYYEQCFEAYRHHHSAEGAVHMALNDGGRFDPDGFYGQARLLEQAWAQTPAADVLELAFGQGFNLAYLAPRMPGTRFSALDLTPRHLAHVQALLQERGVANVALRLGDFHHLPYADASFDHLFCIEGFCHASDPLRGLGEQARVLRPGGTMTLFDGYLTRPLSMLSTNEAMAIRLVAKGMAIERFQVIDELLEQARGVGLQPVTVTVLDAQIMPCLRRLERLTGTVLRLPWLGRRALASRPPMRGRNVLAGYLMRCTVSLGLLGYRQLTLRKTS